MRLPLFALFLILGTSMHAGGDTLHLVTKTEKLSSHVRIQYEVDKSTQVKNGFYIKKYDSELTTEGHYKKGKREGLWKYYFTHDILQACGNYSNGKKEGQWIRYNYNGNITGKMIFTDGKEGETYETYYSSGKMMAISSPDLLTKYYEDGKVSESITMKNGKQNGTAKRFYPNGVLKETRIMKDGKRDSVYLFYYDTGALWEHILYRSGGVWNVVAYLGADGNKLDWGTVKDGNGLMRFYDVNGKTEDEHLYKNTMLEGRTQVWEKEILRQKGDYHLNERTGPWNFYYEEGRLKQEVTYTNGVQEGEEINYFQMGTRSSSGMMHEGKNEGEWKYLLENGKTRSVVHFKKGKLDGPAQYYTNNKISSSGNYALGVKTGMWIAYDAEGIEKSHENLDTPKKESQDEDDLSSWTADRKAVFSFTEQQPDFPGGESALMNFLSTTIKYPKHAKNNGIQGKVVLTFVVTAEGEVTEIKVLKSVDADLDAESVRVVKLMPRWYPGMMNGSPVMVQYNLPISFVLR